MSTIFRPEACVSRRSAAVIGPPAILHSFCQRTEWARVDPPSCTHWRARPSQLVDKSGALGCFVGPLAPDEIREIACSRALDPPRELTRDSRRSPRALVDEPRIHLHQIGSRAQEGQDVLSPFDTSHPNDRDLATEPSAGSLHHLAGSR